MHLYAIIRLLIELAAPDDPGVAQARLAQTLAAVDEVRAIAVTDDRVAFATIDRAGTAHEVVATIDRAGTVIAVVTEASRADTQRSGGARMRRRATKAVAISPARSLGVRWLATELVGTTVVRLVPDAGVVTLVTGSGERYRVDPGMIGERESGNGAASARWAAAWDDEPAPVPEV